MDGGIRKRRHVSQCEGLLRREKPRLLVHLLALSLFPFYPPFIFPTVPFYSLPSLFLSLSCSFLKPSIQTRQKQTKRLARTCVSPFPELDAEDTNPKTQTGECMYENSWLHAYGCEARAKNTHTWRVVVPPSNEGQRSNQRHKSSMGRGEVGSHQARMRQGCQITASHPKATAGN